MINLTQYARLIEAGLNELLAEEYIKFRVWSDVGNYQKAARKYNTVTTYINCILTRSSGIISTGNNGLIIASDGLTLQVGIPKQEPKQTSSEPAPATEDGVFVFIDKIRNIIDAYFSQNKVQSIEENGYTYEAGMVYSIPATGEIDLHPMADELITFSVYITINIVQNGINSRSVSVELDGEAIPFLTASPSRASERATDVYSDTGESETIITSTVFAVEVSQPATTGKVTSQFTEFLMGGQKNIYHFLKLTIGNQLRYYGVTFGDVSASIENSLNVGTVIPFIKVRNDADMLAFPAYFTVGRLTVSNDGNVSVMPSQDCIMDLRGIREVKAGQSVTIAVTNNILDYDEPTDTYFLQIKACPTNNAVVRFTEVTGATLTYDQIGVI